MSGHERSECLQWPITDTLHADATRCIALLYHFLFQCARTPYLIFMCTVVSDQATFLFGTDAIFSFNKQNLIV